MNETIDPEACERLRKLHASIVAMLAAFDRPLCFSDCNVELNIGYPGEHVTTIHLDLVPDLRCDLYEWLERKRDELAEALRQIADYNASMSTMHGGRLLDGHVHDACPRPWRDE